MAVTFYFDVHVPRAIRDQLRLRSVDVLNDKMSGRLLGRSISDFAKINLTGASVSMTQSGIVCVYSCVAQCNPF